MNALQKMLENIGITGILLETIFLPIVFFWIVTNYCNHQRNTIFIYDCQAMLNVSKNLFARKAGKETGKFWVCFSCYLFILAPILILVCCTWRNTGAKRRAPTQVRKQPLGLLFSKALQISRIWMMIVFAFCHLRRARVLLECWMCNNEMQSWSKARLLLRCPRSAFTEKPNRWSWLWPSRMQKQKRSSSLHSRGSWQ